MNTITTKKYNPYIIGILLLLFLQLMPGVLFSFFAGPSASLKLNPDILLISRCYYWVLLAAMWFYAKKVEGTGLLIWKEHAYPFWKYIVFFFGVFIFTLIITAIFGVLYKLTGLKQHSANLDKILLVFKQYPWIGVFTCVTAGITEELVMRGYLQTRLELLFGKAIPAIIVSAVVFGALHYGYGTWYNILGPFILGLIFATFYQKFRNIKVIILVHICWDLLVLSIALKPPHH